MDKKLNMKLPGLRQVFRRTLGVARKVVRRRMRVLALVRTAYRQLARQQDLGEKIRSDLNILLRLARAWSTGRYRSLPWKSVLYVVAAILYFVNPVDLIPDVLVGIGFVDDAAVLAAVVGAVHKDLQNFNRWEFDAESKAEETSRELASPSSEATT